MKKAFEKYLIDRGYKAYTKKGSPSTVFAYSNAIDEVCEEEKYSWADLAGDIDRVLPMYDVGGRKAALGNKRHKTVINALRRFKEFV